MAASHQANKHAFLTMAPPPNYVAGLGRGASGFTTRSDLGPARQASDRGRRDDDKGDDDKADGEEGQFNDQDPENETGLFAGGIYEKDDEEADRIWEAVDNRMDERRREKREAREREELQKLRAERPKIQAQFADLKRGLSGVSVDEWDALPEAGNLTGKKRKKAEKREARDPGRGYVVPDSVLLGARNQMAMDASISADQMNDGTASSLQSTTTSLTDIGEARNKIFSHTLDQAGTATSLGGSSSSIDAQGYLTSLSSLPQQNSAQIGDIKKYRALLDSVIKTNPSHPPGWIAMAGVEEHAGRMGAARKVIVQGCQHCPQSEDVWLESARLHPRDSAKRVVAEAVKALKGQSVKIWLKAAELETDPEAKKRVLRKSLEFLRDSVTLWKELVNLESDPEEARQLLAGAVDAVPSSESLWLTLARLSSPDAAQSVLNSARKKIPTSHAIWIAAGRLAEQTSETASDVTQTKVDGMMAKAVSSLAKAGAVLSRDQWMDEALRVDLEGSPMTAEAIIKATLALGVEDDEDRRIIWVQDAEAAKEKGRIATARAILAYTLRLFPDKGSIWRFAIDLEREAGDAEGLDALLEKAVTSVPKSETLWLIYAKTKWSAGDIHGARQVLARAFERNIGSEEIPLAAAKLEYENGEKAAARELLQRARSEVATRRVWIKSAVLERDEGRPSEALKIVEEGLLKHNDEPKLWLMRAQLLQSDGVQTSPAEGIRAAREVLSKAVRACPTSVDLWLAASRLEESANLTIRARAILEKARIVNPSNDVLLLEAAKVEKRAGSLQEYKRILSRGLQERSNSGLLWAESLFAEPSPTRKSRAKDGLDKTTNDARVVCAVALHMWNEGKYESARNWFRKMIERDSTWGDGYAWFVKFEQEEVKERKGSMEAIMKIVELAKKNEARYGEVFQRVNKSEEKRKNGWGMQEVLEKVASLLIVPS